MSQSNKRIGFFGGGFDPIHIGHMILAQYALEELRLDTVLFVPTGGPPYYKQEQNFSPGHRRWEMVNRAITPHECYDLSSYEVEQKKFCYTYDTLRHLQSVYPEGTDLILLVGGDWKEKIPTWQNGEALLHEFKVAFFPRPGYETNEKVMNQESEQSNLLWFDMPLIDISSTMIRKRVRKGLPIDYMVPYDVKQFIYKYELYHT